MIDGETGPDGFLVEVMRTIAKRQGWDVTFRSGSRSDCLDWLEKGDIDVLGGVVFAEEHAHRFHLGRESLLTAWGQIYVQPGAAIESVLDLGARKIAVLKSDQHYWDFRDVIERFGLQCRFIEADDYETVLMMVAAGRCDAGIVNQFYGDLHHDQFGLIKSAIVFSPRKLYFAARQGHRSGLMAAIDHQLWELKRDKRSAYHLALARWFRPQTEYPIPKWFNWFVLGIVLLTLVLMLHSVVMQRIVRSKTRELSAKNQALSDLYTRLQQELVERRRVEDKLLQAQKMEAIGTLAGGIAHDFNNILGAIIGFTEISIDDLPKDASVRANMEQVLQAGNRARDLVKQILAFSRKSNADHELTNLVPITKEVLKLVRASLPSTIEIQSSVPADISMIMADPIQMHQVIMNLCTNAAHAMEDGGGRLDVELAEVVISGEECHRFPEVRSGNYVQLIVRDNGHGIDPEIVDRIFDPYFTTKEIDKGTGMGLAMVHGIVTRQKGCIRVRSQIAQGAEFEILFPVAQKQVEGEFRLDTPPLRGNERVLFVDDEPALAQLGKSMLERLGYEVRSCTSSMEALEAFRTDPDRFDILVTDLTMPTMTGIHLAQKLRALRHHLPVVVCTGYSEQMTPEHARSLGISGYLYKPLVLSALSQEVRAALDECRAFFN